MEEESRTTVLLVAWLAGLIARGGYLFAVAAAAIIVPLLIIWSLVS